MTVLDSVTDILWNIVFYSTLTSALIWIIILALPWRPWGVRESLDSNMNSGDSGLSDITVLIPARNEAEHIGTTLDALLLQGSDLKIIVIDDQSSDQTATIVRSYQTQTDKLSLIDGSALAEGWSGKLWALQQGLQQVNTAMVLLLDADITLHPGMLATLKHKKNSENLQMISVMARLPMQNFWEKLLLPAFVYFFKLLYPFALNNNPRWRKIAAAAGGCILINKKVLTEIDAFDSIRDALIDDCSLARKVKQHGNAVWLGLSHSLDSGRTNHKLSDIWQMVARTAFTQLHYSWSILVLMTAIMLVVYLLPIAGLFYSTVLVKLIASLCLLIMVICYIPTLRYYQLSPFWALLMPLIASLFLAMSWSSALAYASGGGSFWKQRVYNKSMKVAK
ncbi:MAG: glycosyltransferase [Thiohalomonadales bacterium]